MVAAEGSGLMEEEWKWEEAVMVMMVEGGQDGDVLGLLGRRLGMGLEVR